MQHGPFHGDVIAFAASSCIPQYSKRSAGQFVLLLHSPALRDVKKSHPS